VTATSYTPGDWLGIVGPGATVLLPPGEKERAGAIWALVDDGAGFGQVLDALLAQGLSGLTAFVLVAENGVTTQVVVRGDVTAAFETAAGSVTVSGNDATTWVERTLTSVDRLSVSVGDASGPSYVVESGLVRVSGIEVPPPTTVPAPSDTSAPSEPSGATSGSGPSLALVPPAYDGPAAPDPLGDPLGLDDVPTDTDLPAVTDSGPVGVPPAFPPPGPFAPPAAPSAPVSSPETGSGLALPVARLDLSSGQQVDVDRVIVVGRAPDPNRFAPTDQPLLVTVPSPHQEISSTHLEVRPGTGADHGNAVVTDLGSTNGTLLVRPGQGPEELRPGVPVVLEAGVVIDLGDGLTITVQNP
jgi:hypothetical protein